MLWRVWLTRPAVPSVVSEEFRGGWLCFDSELGRRRLAPIPIGWERADPERLEFWLRKATPIRHSPPFGMLAPDLEDEAS